MRHISDVSLWPWFICQTGFFDLEIMILWCTEGSGKACTYLRWLYTTVAPCRPHLALRRSQWWRGPWQRWRHKQAWYPEVWAFVKSCTGYCLWLKRYSILSNNVVGENLSGGEKSKGCVRPLNSQTERLLDHSLLLVLCKDVNKMF